MSNTCALDGCRQTCPGGVTWCHDHDPGKWKATFPHTDEWPLTGTLIVTCGDCDRLLTVHAIGDRAGDRAEANRYARARLGSLIATLNTGCACPDRWRL